MRWRIFVGAALLAGLGLAGADDKPADKDARFDRLKSLVGEWVPVGEDGKPKADVVCVYKLTAGGSAVHETLFPGTPMEMITVYHKDGKDLVLTHYCCVGNQPRMKCDAAGTDDVLRFKFSGGTNIDPTKDMHMHDATIKFVDADTVETTWVGYAKGKPDDAHQAAFKMVRKKK